MAGRTGPNSPDRRPAVDHVRQLQRRLWVAAKRSPTRRFHALMDRIWRDDVLWEAWRRVKTNRGAAGVDRQTLDAIEQRGGRSFLEDLGTALRAGTYRPQLVLRRYIPKADGRQRPLGIPTVRDRVAQMAATLVLQPIFEADFRASSYGFRPKRSATQALETLRVHGARGGNHVLDADIRDYFGSIDHTTLLTLVRQRISDRRVLKLLRLWLTAGVLEDGAATRTMAARRRARHRRCSTSTCTSSTGCGKTDAHLARWSATPTTSWSCVTRRPRSRPRQRVGALLTPRAQLHPEKTRVVDLVGTRGFDFLGVTCANA
jgi:hypothetical protein